MLMTVTTMKPFDLSIIIPVYNEEESIQALYRRIEEALVGCGLSHEIVFVDDGSTDNSLQMLQELQQTASDSANVRIVQLSRNFGQHPALIAGFSAARGPILVTMDADLQIDPEHIVKLMNKMAEGYDFVSGIRVGSGDSFFLRRLPSRVLGYIIGSVAGKKLGDYGCPLNAMRAEIAVKMREYGEMQRFFKPLAIRLSERIAEVEVAYGPRIAGRSKYRFLDLFDLLFDFITNFSKQLFQRVAIAGIGLCGISFLIGMLYLVLRFPLGVIHQPYDRLLVILLLGFFFGIHLLVLGVLGDFIIRIYRKVGAKPLFRIKKIW